MTGAYHIVVSNKFLKYEFDIRRNITVIRGNSATGKTALVEMIREYNELDDAGIQINSPKKCIVLYGKDWMERLERIQDSIVFIDEVSRFVKSVEFSEMAQHSDNYYVIISREKLANLPYSIHEIYGIRKSGKYAGLDRQYTENELYPIYGDMTAKEFQPEVMITEDSNAGHDFFEALGKQNDIAVDDDFEHCAGNSDVLARALKQEYAHKRKLLIVDGAAFGAEMDKVMNYIQKVSDGDMLLFAPESFEYLLLCAELFPSNKIKQVLHNPSDYIESSKYFSWERYFTDLLEKETQNLKGREYKKERLNVYYLKEDSIRRIVSQFPKQIKWEKG